MLTGYKTLIFNAVMAVVFVARSFFPDADLPNESDVNSIVDQLLAHWDQAALLVGNIWLRFKTSTAIFTAK